MMDRALAGGIGPRRAHFSCGMAGIAQTALSQCGRCGHAYRLPSLPGAYACPACRTPLQGEAPARRSVRIPLWAIGALAVVVLSVSLPIAWRQFFPTRARARDTRNNFPDVRVTQPPNFQKRLEEKVALLEEDLQRELKANRGQGSGDEILLRERLVDAYLGLATYHWYSVRLTGEEWQVKAQKMVRALRDLDPSRAAQKEPMAQDPGRLRWTLPQQRGEDGALARALRGGLRAETPPTGDSALPLASSAPGSFANPSRGPRPGAASSPSGNDQGSSLGSAPPMGAPGFDQPGLVRSPTLPPPGDTSRPAPRGVGLEDRLRGLDRLIEAYQETVRANPNDLTSAHELGANLERRAIMRLESGAGGDDALVQADIERALRVYQGALPRSKLRLHRGTFLMATASIHTALGRDEEAYRDLKRASQATPYTPRIWRELHRVCIRTRRWQEGYDASIKSREWLFPELLLQ